MTESGYGHIGRIPNYGHRGQPDNRTMAEAPACIQNAMMTKDKKPFTYTPGGLDLSQIRTPSMARRFARQRSQEEHEQSHARQDYAQANGRPPAGGVPPPPFQGSPGGPPPPPPPPPLVINTPSAAAAKPETVIKPIGERPEIVIPENPIGMLRKTNSPYHWEQEEAEKERLGAVPKFIEKIPGSVMQQNTPTSFSQQPATYANNNPNNVQRHNYPYGGLINRSPDSPLHKPEPQYPENQSIPFSETPTRDLLQRQDSQFNKSPTPFGPQGSSPRTNGSPISANPNNTWKEPQKPDSRDLLQRQDSQFNKSPTPFGPQGNSPHTNGPPNSVNRNNTWREPEKRDSPLISASPQQRSPLSPTISNRSSQYTPTVNSSSPYQNDSQSPVYHTLPRASPRVQDNYTDNSSESPPRNVFNNTIFNNVRQEPIPDKVNSNNPAPWRTNTINRPQQRYDNNYAQVSNNQNFDIPPYYKPAETAAQPVKNNPWKTPQNYHNASKQNQQGEQNVSSWQQNQRNENNPWTQNQQNDANSWINQQNGYQSFPVSSGQHSDEMRYQTHISVPVPPKRQHEQLEHAQPRPQQQQPSQPSPSHSNVEKVYVNQEPVYYCGPNSPRSIPAFVKMQKEKTPPPEWAQRPLDGRKSLTRELVSPPRDKPRVEPEWVQKSNEMRSVPRDISTPPTTHQNVQPTWSTKPSENRKSLPRDSQPEYVQSPIQNGHRSQDRVIPIQVQSEQSEDRQPQLRIIIDMPHGQSYKQQAEPPYSQPTQRIMKVMSPQLVRMDQPEEPRYQDRPRLNEPRTRIIPIQLEDGSNGAPKRRVYYHQFSTETGGGPPRQSRSFRVLQTITGTMDSENVGDVEHQHGISDL